VSVTSEIPKKALVRFVNDLEGLTRQGSEILVGDLKGVARIAEHDADMKVAASGTPLDHRLADRPDRPMDHPRIDRQAGEVREGTHDSLRDVLTGDSADPKGAFRWIEQTPGLPFRWKVEDVRRSSTKFRSGAEIMVEGAMFDGRRRIGHTHTAFSMGSSGKITAHVREFKIYDHFDDKEYRGKGFLRAFDRVLDDPRLSEVDSILVYGQLPNGGCPWVGVGYDWHRSHPAFAASTATMADHVRGMLDRASSPGDRAMLSGLLTEIEGAPADIRSAREIYAMRDSRGTPIGQELLRNTPFPGTREPRSTAPATADHTVVNAENRTEAGGRAETGTNYWEQPGYQYEYPTDRIGPPGDDPTRHAREQPTAGPSLDEVINPKDSSGR
jgi:hypothetical protein